MKGSGRTSVLIVKHFPAELTLEEREDFLKHFGAVAVRCMPDKGKLKYTCFATFSNEDAAEAALSRIHQQELLGRRLTAEFAKEAEEKYAPHVSDYPKFRSEDVPKPKLPLEKEELKAKLQDVSKRLHGIAPILGLDYLPSPMLKYKYPPPTPTIIANISHCLASVPKFYVQVLHLMNKMNLPAPFGPLTPVPPLMSQVIPIPFEVAPPPAAAAAPQPQEEKMQEEEMEVTETESELESEGESENKQLQASSQKRPRPTKKVKKKQDKRRRLEMMLHPPTIPSAADSAPISKIDPSGVFETPGVDVQAAKKIQIHIKPPGTEGEATEQSEVQQESKEAVIVQEGGFGVIVAPQDKGTGNQDAGENSDEEWWLNIHFIPIRDIKRNRISEKEMSSLSVFKNYEAGVPASRLYIKNLAKQTTEKDLRAIYGQYIDISSETERNMFDIRLMKEGRMKGQAFITLASEEEATKAVRDTNGYVLHGKPMVVQFARSAKPKEKATNEKGK